MALILLDQVLFTEGHKLSHVVNRTCPASLFSWTVPRKRRSAARPGATIAFAPPYPLQHREQDQISEAAAIRENPRVWRQGEQLALAQLDGVFDSAGLQILKTSL
jgi:hypothetical protein